MPTKTAFRPRLRLSPVTPNENELAEAVARFLELMVLPPAEWTCFPAGIVPLPAAHASKLRRFGLKRGWPDYLLVHGGRIYGLELKAVTGVLSKGYMARTAKGGLVWREGQAEVFPRLLAAGMQVRLARSIPDVVSALTDWGIPMRKLARSEPWPS